MFKFGKFKTSFNIYNEKSRKPRREYDNIGSTISLNGAYRTTRDEFYVYSIHRESERKSTPSVPGPPIPPPIPNELQVPLRQTKSTSDLVKEQNLPPALREAQSGVSLDPRGGNSEIRNSRIPAAVDTKKLDAQKRVEKQRVNEQKKLEKKRLAEEKKLAKQQLDEQKKREKLASKERVKQEKLRKEKEKKDAALQKKQKRAAPQNPLANPLAQSSGQSSNAVPQTSQAQYSTNTLESSISKTSGPPPYTEVSKSRNDKVNSNVSYSQPEDTGSWDMITQHRENVINKTPNKAPTAKPKVTSLDLNFSLAEDGKKSNSEV